MVDNAGCARRATKYLDPRRLEARWPQMLEVRTAAHARTEEKAYARQMR